AKKEESYAVQLGVIKSFLEVSPTGEVRSDSASLQWSGDGSWRHYCQGGIQASLRSCCDRLWSLGCIPLRPACGRRRYLHSSPFGPFDPTGDVIHSSAFGHLTPSP